MPGDNGRGMAVMGTSRARRRLWAAVAIVSLAVPLVLTPPASASAEGCVGSGRDPRSCVRVHGAGTYVDWVQGGVLVGLGSEVRGHFEIYGADLRFVTEDETYSNESYFRVHKKWGKKFDLKRDLPDKSEVCASFFHRKGDGTYEKRSPACVEIQR